MKNLWILTEERPKKEVIGTIIEKFAEDRGMAQPLTGLFRIVPILENACFTFVYRVEGIYCEGINEIFLKNVSGASSFVDFLVFYQDEEPSVSSQPIYAIEETKTDDAESRNTGVYQRCAKFVFIDFYYPRAKKIMLYNLKLAQKPVPTPTSIFGTKLLLGLGVEILGKRLDSERFKSFESIDAIIRFKNGMKRPPRGNVPILIEKSADEIRVSGRLIKSGRLAHDPNIGALALISQSLRNLGWTGAIVITQHGLEQHNIGRDNKFIQIANQIRMQLAGLTVPDAELPKTYWHYETESEKLATIFIHLVVEEFTQARAIFDNHAGGERGYFQKIGRHVSETEYMVLEKYEDRDAYKAGNRAKRVSLPDLILFDRERNEIINIEGKKFKNRRAGIKQLANYDAIEGIYIRKHYGSCPVIRTVVIYGGQQTVITEPEIGFLLTAQGALVLGEEPPQIFVEAINNLLAARN